MNMLKAQCPRVVFTSLLLLSPFAEAEGAPLPQPDPESGSIGVTIRAIAPAKTHLGSDQPLLRADRRGKCRLDAAGVYRYCHRFYRDGR